MATVSLEFEYERDTKNTVRFAETVEDGDPTLVGTLYLQKFANKELGNPERIRVTIEAVD